MKTSKILATSAICVATLGVAAGSAYAGSIDAGQQSAKTDLKLGFKDDINKGPLDDKIVITKVPDVFDFGNDNTVSTTQQTIKTKERTGQYFAISDLRKDNDKKAWDVTVTASNFEALDQSDVIKDARLSFNNSAVKFITNPDNPNPDPNTGLIETIPANLESGDIAPQTSNVQQLITDGKASQTVLKAEKAALPTGEVGTQISDVKLDVMANTGKKNTQYRADLTWSLNAVPKP